MASIEDLRIEDPPKGKPVSRNAWRTFALILLGVILLGGIGMTWQWKTGLDSVRAALYPEQRIPTAEARERAIEPSPTATPIAAFTAGGYVEIIPPGPVAVTTRVEGWVQSVEIVEGIPVKAGQVLVVLDDTTHRQALAEARAEVALAQARLDRMQAGFRTEEIAEAQARLRQAEARVIYSRSEFERNEQLVKIGATASRQLLTLRAELTSAEADLASASALFYLKRAGQRPEDIAVARAELAQAETRLERLHWQLDRCVIRAPVDGMVLDLFVRVGDWIHPSLNRDDQGAVLTLFDPTGLQVWVEVNQRDAGRVSVGQSVTMRTDAFRDRNLHGRVVRVMPRASLQRNTVEVKIEFTDAAGNPISPDGLRPEMSVQVTFPPPEPQIHEQGVS